MTGKEFSSIRNTLKITQKRLPEYIGHAYRTIQDWEASEKVPDYAEKVILLLESNMRHSHNTSDEVEILKKELKKQEKYIASLEDNVDMLKQKLYQYEPKTKQASN